MITQARDINRDPSYSITVDPDISLGISLDSNATIILAITQVTQIAMALVAVCPSDCNMVSGYHADPKYLLSIVLKHTGLTSSAITQAYILGLDWSTLTSTTFITF